MEYTGSVRVKTGKNGTVSYQIVIEGEKDPVTGKRMRSYQTVHGKKRDAIRIMNQIVAEKNTGTYFKGSNLLLKDWLDQWISGSVITVSAIWKRPPLPATGTRSTTTLYQCLEIFRLED